MLIMSFAPGHSLNFALIYLFFKRPWLKNMIKLNIKLV